MTELIFSGVSKRYGTTPVLDEIDIIVPAGSRTVIVGPSGSGKTTLLRLAAGFEVPDAGRILLGDTILAEAATAVPPHRRDIGYVTQEGALFPHLSVAANIGFGIPRDAADRDTRISELMERVGLPREMTSRRPHQLSGGQQQRVALARAMARQPRLMLLDEPFSALDTDLRDATREMVGEVLSAAGITTILVTHDRAEALSFADNIAVLREGRAVQAGTPQHLYLYPADRQTAHFLGDAVILDALVENGAGSTILGRIPVHSAPGAKVIMLRPEQIHIGPPTDSDRTRGRIVSVNFQGSAFRVVVEHDGVEAVESFTCTVSGALAPYPGMPVEIWLSGAAHVLDN